MKASSLRLTVRTPREIVFEIEAESVRVPTKTGQVGLRPRVEQLVLAVEPGLILVRRDQGVHFLGTAGGLLRCDGVSAVLITPLAVYGDEEEKVMRNLDAELAQPDAELELRSTLNRLQSTIVTELRQDRDQRASQVRDRP